MDFNELSDNIVLGWHFSTLVVVYEVIEVVVVTNLATLLQYSNCLQSASISVNQWRKFLSTTSKTRNILTRNIPDVRCRIILLSHRLVHSDCFGARSDSYL